MTQTNQQSKRHIKLLNDFLESKPAIKATTKTNYKNTFNKLILNIFDTDKQKYILKTPTNDVLQTIENLNIPLNSKIDLVKMYKYITEFKKKSTVEIDDSLNFMYANTDTVGKNDQLLNTLIKYDELIAFLNKLDYINYILFYIIINFNVRNMDLVIYYTDEKPIIKKALDGKLDYNILYFDKNKLIYVRCHYKTSKSYGVKTHIITNTKFINIVKDLDVNDFIFKNRNNKPRKSDEINKFVSSVASKHGIHNLNQQNIYKIIVNHFKTDYNAMKKLSINRGHTLDTQSQYYI